MRLFKLLLAVATATAVFSALTATTSARNLEFSSQTLRATFREVVFNGLFGETRCQLTIEGSFHARTMTKERSTLLGHITRAALGPCAAGSRATVLSEWLPWHVRFGAFTGTLPNITTLRYDLAFVAFRFRTNVGENCLILSLSSEPMVLSFNRTGGVLATANWSNEVKTGPECSEIRSRVLSDNGPVTVLNSATRITVTLI